MEDNPVYVGLENPVQIRREILLCTKDMLSALKTYEKYKKLREEKRAKISEFGKILKELNTAANKFRKNFPKSRLKSLAKQAVPEAKKSEPPKKSKIKEIEEKLDLIEEQVGRL